MATADHSIPTHDRALPIADQMAAAQVQMLTDNCREFGIPLHGLGSPNQGIVHIIGPELGLTQPGMTIVCGDSHTATHGAFGALAFGIGTSEVEMVLATQCLLQRRPKTYEVRVDGRLTPSVGAKDIILALIAQIGVGDGTGHVFEYTGEAIRSLTMEQRMTVCNMSIEGGARAGLVAPDDVTFAYIEGRPHPPRGAAWDAAGASWRRLPTAEGATYDRTIAIDASALEPMVTYGTNPGMGIPITGRIPSPDNQADPAQRRGEPMARRRRLGTVKTIARRTVLGGMAAVFLAACSAGSVSTEPPRPNLPPVAVPGDPGQPIGTRPAPGDPGIGGLPGSQPAIVIPKPGRLGVHPVGATSLEARVDGRRVRVTVSWWSGVAPCNVLDSVAQIRDGANITIELREGADQLGVACIEIAMLKTTVVDLGELLPDAYVISAGGDAAPIRVIVP